MTHAPILNITGYKFVQLKDLVQIKATLLNLCKKNHIKGTILVAPEGVNVNLSGKENDIRAVLRGFQEIDFLKDLVIKESRSDTICFNRMLVRLKKEIISFGQDGLDPENDPAPYISSKELESWYETGKNFHILDTRNTYEVNVGTFEKAIDPKIESFREFVDYVRSLPQEMKEQPIVTFCTGGVRCEKAAPFMLKEGFKEVYQLDGGILKYFEDVGGNHYEGDCFVFDQRVALNPARQANGMAQCFACRHPLTPEELKSSLYQAEVSCPHCHGKAPYAETPSEEATHLS